MNKKSIISSATFFVAWLLMIYPCIASKQYHITHKMLEKRIDECFNNVSGLQVKEDSYLKFPEGFSKKKGLYESWLHFHIKGGLKEKIIRNNFQLFDNNFFVTAWIQEILLESQNFGLIGDIDDQLTISINQLIKFSDKNNPNSSIISFWQQEDYNIEKDIYYCFPEIIVTVIKFAVKVADFISLIVKILGFEHILDGILEKINLTGFFDQIERIVGALHIPPDTDDSSLNISLGCLLKEYSDKANSSHYRVWEKENNVNTIEKLLDKCVKYSYKPFSSANDNTCTEIDPRTYFFMHEYLDTKYGQGEISLLTTWLTIRNETVCSAPYVHMPFSVNNVDVSVCANFINALANYAVTFPAEMDTLFNRVAGLKKLIFDTSEYLEWAITQNKILERPDIGALYYPPVLNTYWFVARTISLLSGKRNFEMMSDQSHKIFDAVLNTFNNAMAEAGVASILNMARNIVIDSKTGKTALFWDDFLGEHDKNVCPLNKNDDRVYTSAIALNSLIDICTERIYISNKDSEYTIEWKNGIQDKVKNSINSGIAGLLRTSGEGHGILDLLFRKENAFFSGSVKENTFPYYYPYNILEPLIEKQANQEEEEVYSGKVVALKGYLEKAEYNLLVEKFNPPTEYTKYKNSGPFPYWSSPALTHALVINVLSKYSHLIDDENM